MRDRGLQGRIERAGRAGGPHAQQPLRADRLSRAAGTGKIQPHSGVPRLNVSINRSADYWRSRAAALRSVAGLRARWSNAMRMLLAICPSPVPCWLLLTAPKSSPSIAAATAWNDVAPTSPPGDLGSRREQVVVPAGAQRMPSCDHHCQLPNPAERSELSG